MYASSFFRGLCKESSNFPLPNGIIPSSPKRREGLGSFNESLIGEEPASRAHLVVTLRKEFLEEFFGKCVIQRTLAHAIFCGRVSITGATISPLAAAHPIWAWSTAISTIWWFILTSSHEGQKQEEKQREFHGCWCFHG